MSASASHAPAPGSTLRILGLLIALSTFLLSTGCGVATWRPGALRPFEMDPAFEIDDTDIQRAFEAKPQMPTSIRVAVFSYDTEHVEEVEASLARTPGVESVYRIPLFLVTGEHRYDATGGQSWPPPQPQPLSLKKLRMLAARAHADVLVVVDYGYRQEVTPNGLIALNVLLLPSLFSPYLDVEVQSFMDSYVLDVRNGYLYGHVAAQEQGGERWVTIYGLDSTELVDGQRPKLLTSTQEALGGIIQASQQETLEAQRSPQPTPTTANEANEAAQEKEGP